METLNPEKRWLNEILFQIDFGLRGLGRARKDDNFD